MIRAAAHEDEPVLEPVRHPKAEYAGVERGILLRLGNDEGKMAELDRPDAGHLLVLADRSLRGEHLADRALGILERQHPGDAGRWIVARLAAHAFGLDSAPDIVELRVWCDLERQPRATRVVTLFQLHREIAKLGGEEGAAVLPLRQHQTSGLGEIVNLSVEIRRLECRVANPFDVDHGHSEASIALR